MAELIFRGYDRPGLDREYDNRAKVPDFAGYLQRWGDRSRAARDHLRAQLNIAYGSGPDEMLDLFCAQQGGPAPVNVFFHGGYWKALHKDDFSFVAHALAGTGAATVVVNYALVPLVEMDELVRQCRSALAWVWRNARELRIDRDRIHVCGHSAGGHLVAMLMATDWPVFDPALPADPIAGGCGVSGLYDLEPIRLCFLNVDLGLSEDDARRNSPALLERRVVCPLLLPVGGLEGAEYLRQSQALASAWGGAAPAPEVMVMAGLDHFSIADQLDDSGSPLAQAIQRQMGLT